MSETTTEKQKHISDATFQQDVIDASGPVLVDFWADWCGPCHAIAPTLDEIAREYAGRLTVAKLNIDENPKTPSVYAVRSIPTLALFKDGELKDVSIGVQSKSQLKEFVEEHIV